VINVLIVDDQAMIREGFAALLGAQPDIVVLGDVANGAEAVTACRRLDPDVVLMDVRMPVMDGLAATERILSGPPGQHLPKILILTSARCAPGPAASCSRTRPPPSWYTRCGWWPPGRRCWRRR
jgi:DNA-binding NarL/FixJ family response regulator